MEPPERYQRLAEDNLRRWPRECDAPEPADGAQVLVLPGDWGEVTPDMSRRYEVRCAALNMANAYVPGGAYVEGAPAQEENMYRRTDCHFFIDENVYDRQRDRYRPEMTRLLSAEDGLVYLDSERPRVCIRGPEDRGREDLGYPWLADDQVFSFYELRASAQDLRDGSRFDPDEARRRIAAQLDTLRRAPGPPSGAAAIGYTEPPARRRAAPRGARPSPRRHPRHRRTRSMLLSGKTAVITGAASARGIGRRTAQVFAAHGARVALLDLDAEASAAAAAEIGDGHLGLACDVTRKSDCETAARRVNEALGPADILVNNAGISQPLQLMDIEPQHYEAVTDVSLRGTLYMSQALIPQMRGRGGSIICLSSVSAQRGGGIFGGPHYSAAKGGVLGLARAMARELGPERVRVNAIAPGLIDTDITGGKLQGALLEEILKGIPLGRVGSTDDVANACLFLASDLSSYLTGITLDVNGGMLIH